MNSVIIFLTLARTKNELNNADSVLEAAKMENKSLSENLMIIAKERTKLQNKLQSQLDNRRLDAMKLNEYITQNQKLLEEITMIRKNLENINNSHSEKCQEIENVTKENKDLKIKIDELNRKIRLYENEHGSYKKTVNEMNRAQRTFLQSYGNEAKFKQKADGIQVVIKDNSQNLTSIKAEFTEVIYD